jgi:thiol-disulfide isomerase/thioredoxin
MKAGTAATWAAIVLLGGLSAGLGWWLGQRHQEASGPPLPAGLAVVEAGQPAPAILLPDLRSGELRPLVAPCREEMPLLDAFAQTQGGNGVEVVGIALDAREEALRFLDQVPVRFPQLQEPPGPGDSSVRLGNRRGVLPFTALIDRDGRLQKIHYGPFASAAEIQAWATVP